MESVLLVIHLIIAILLVTVILLQKSDDGALGGLGGGSSSNMSIFSARGKGNILTRITTILAVVFFVTSITLSLIHRGENRTKGSILEVEATDIATEAEANTDAAPVVPISEE